MLGLVGTNKSDINRKRCVLQFRHTPFCIGNMKYYNFELPNTKNYTLATICSGVNSLSVAIF